MHQELIDRCNQVGCRVSDFVKASIEFSLYGSVEFDFGRNCDDDEPEQKPTHESRIHVIAASKPKDMPKLGGGAVPDMDM